MKSIWNPWVGTFTVLAGLVGTAYVSRYQGGASRAHAATKRDEATVVKLVKPKLAAADRTLSVTGTTDSQLSTNVHARASGYVRSLHVDMGDRVKAKQILAELDTPELDREIEQADASLAQAAAAVELAKAALVYSQSTLERIQVLNGRQLTSKQELEQLEAQSNVDRAKVQVAEASRAAAQANLHRLRQLKSFARVTAPFAGTVVARKVERGSLVSAGTATPLFVIATTDQLRVNIDVPQSLAPAIVDGSPARVSVPEYPSLTIDGKVARSAHALDPTTRTMKVEVQLKNVENKLVPGMFANVSLTLPSTHRALILPATALISHDSGLQVAKVDKQHRVQLVPVELQRDNGADVEIAGGLSLGDQLVANPGPALRQGSLVRAAR